MKNGGADLRILPKPEHNQCRNAVSEMSKKVDQNSLMVGFFILRKDRTLVAGWSYESGVTYADMMGAAETLKDEMRRKEWDS